MEPGSREEQKAPAAAAELSPGEVSLGNTRNIKKEERMEGLAKRVIVI